MKRASCMAMLAFALAACGERVPEDLSGAQVGARFGDPARGRIALTQYACHACHVIPGVTGSKVYVGPPLA
ncbi:MAG TPA: hypothetical protein VN361_12890, partial [Oxalicibacterium sp.]|nr:hypothetical protein [Oxalicibacterium sp.]